jgi:hypothetical protein
MSSFIKRLNEQERLKNYKATVAMAFLAGILFGMLFLSAINWYFGFEKIHGDIGSEESVKVLGN